MTLPILFTRQMADLLGPAFPEFLQAMQLPPRIGMRLNPAKPSQALPADAVPTPWNPDGYILPQRPDFTLMPEFHAGAFYAQEPASMAVQTLIARLADAPVRILDLCAAPGGKSTAILAAMPPGSVLVANEVIPQRAAILRENILKWGHPDVMVTSARPEAFTSLRSVFDIILVDAPCSGEGMMRKDPEAVAQWNPALVKHCAALQTQILDDIIPALRPGGHLIFSTCTFNREENDQNVARLIEEYGFSKVDFPDIPVRFMPHVTPSEGLFLQTLQAPGDEPARRLPAAKPFKLKTTVPQLLAGQERFAPVDLKSPDNSVFLLDKAHHSLFAALQKHKIRILHSGVEMGAPKGRDFIPSGSLPLSSVLAEDAFPRVEVSKDQALEFLRRNPVLLPPDTPRGYILLTFSSLPLGLVKNLGNRSNNLWPAPWRIRTK